MIIQSLDTFPCHSFKEREFIAGLRWLFIDLINHFGPGNMSYTYSNMLQHIFSQGGRLFIIEDIGLPIPHWNFSICLPLEYLLSMRINNPQLRAFDVIVILEDSTSLFDPAQDLISPSGVSILAHNLNIFRELRIGIVPICHSLSQISRKVLVNIENYFCCSLRGDNLHLAQQILGISSQQAEFLRVNPRGTACTLTPSVWPYPVLIEYPDFMEQLK